MNLTRAYVAVVEASCINVLDGTINKENDNNKDYFASNFINIMSKDDSLIGDIIIENGTYKLRIFQDVIRKANISIEEIRTLGTELAYNGIEVDLSELEKVITNRDSLQVDRT